MAYGDNRQLLASDTFNSAISASWDNGTTGFIPCIWITGGHVGPTGTNDASTMRRNLETYAADQYSKVTVQANGGSGRVGAAVRMAADPTIEQYHGRANAVGTVFQIVVHVAGTPTTIASDTDATNIPMAAGETLTLEVEGTTLRLGSSASGSDIQELTVTNASLTTGRPGINLAGSGENNLITAWEGGDISVGAAPTVTVPATQKSALGYEEDIGSLVTFADDDSDIVELNYDASMGVFACNTAGTSVVATGNGTGTLNLTGTHAELLTVHATVTYTATVIGTDTLTMTVTDALDATDEDTFSIVNGYMYIAATTQAILNTALAEIDGLNDTVEQNTISMTAYDSGGRSGTGQTVVTVSEEAAGVGVPAGGGGGSAEKRSSYVQIG